MRYYQVTFLLLRTPDLAAAGQDDCIHIFALQPPKVAKFLRKVSSDSIELVLRYSM